RLALKARTRAARRRDIERQALLPTPTRSASEASHLGELQIILDEELQHLAEKYRAAFVLSCLETKSRQASAPALPLNQATAPCASRLRCHKTARPAVPSPPPPP